MPRLLELFAGTGSVGRAYRQLGWDVMSLDINPGHSIQADILDWAYADFEPGYFDAIHASPPCTQYSIARTNAKTPRDLDGADAIVRRTLEIIHYFQPSVWTMENPYSGMMKSRPCMAPLQALLRVVTYCRYGSPYRKSTAIWTNLGEHWEPRPPCCKANPCAAMVDGRHPQTAQRAPGKVNGVRRASAADSFTQDELYALPAALCDELAAAATRAVRSHS
jgi:hypothetical protein